MPSHTDSSPGTGTTSWSPTDGGSFALAKTDGPGSYQQLYQSFSAIAGDTLTLDYFWDSQRVYNESNEKGNDEAYGWLFQGTTGDITSTAWPSGEELFHHSVADDPSIRFGTNWLTETISFAESGDYTLWFGVSTGSAGIAGDSYIGIDNVQLVAVPVPAAVILGMLGLGVAGMRLRKYA